MMLVLPAKSLQRQQLELLLKNLTSIWMGVYPMTNSALGMKLLTQTLLPIPQAKTSMLHLK